MNLGKNFFPNFTGSGPETQMLESGILIDLQSKSACNYPDGYICNELSDKSSEVRIRVLLFIRF